MYTECRIRLSKHGLGASKYAFKEMLNAYDMGAVHMSKAVHMLAGAVHMAVHMLPGRARPRASKRKGPRRGLEAGKSVGPFVNPLPTRDRNLAVQVVAGAHAVDSAAGSATIRYVC